MTPDDFDLDMTVSREGDVVSLAIHENGAHFCTITMPAERAAQLAAALMVSAGDDGPSA